VSTLLAALQYLNGHETAPPHRHTPAALRFVVEGARCVDVGRRPSVIHEQRRSHSDPKLGIPRNTANPTSEAMVWLDVLDLPVVAALDAIFFEKARPKPSPPEQINDQQTSFRGTPGLVPTTDPRPAGHRAPSLAYPWVQIGRRAKRPNSTLQGPVRPAIRYNTDPIHGGDVMPTMRCEMQPYSRGPHDQGRAAKPVGQVACVLHGVGKHACWRKKTLTYTAGDVIAIPSWRPWSISAGAGARRFFSPAMRRS